MPEPKYLWRIQVHGIAKPIYLIAQNAASAAAQATNHPQVDTFDLLHIRRVDSWDDAQNMTVVTWPAPPPEPQPEPEPPP